MAYQGHELRGDIEEGVDELMQHRAGMASPSSSEKHG
jgi:hypothetical protein